MIIDHTLGTLKLFSSGRQRNKHINRNKRSIPLTNQKKTPLRTINNKPNLKTKHDCRNLEKTKSQDKTRRELEPVKKGQIEKGSWWFLWSYSREILCSHLEGYEFYIQVQCTNIFSWFSIALPQHHGSQDMSLSLLVASRLVFIALNDLGSECGQTKGNWNWFGLVKYNGYAMEHGTVIRLPCEMWFHHRIRILRLPFHFSFGWASADISGCCSYIFRASRGSASVRCCLWLHWTTWNVEMPCRLAGYNVHFILRGLCEVIHVHGHYYHSCFQRMVTQK